MNIYLTVVLFIIIGDYVLNLVVEILNVRHISLDLPNEFQGYYDSDKYRKSQQYLKTKTYFGFVSDTFFL